MEFDSATSLLKAGTIIEKGKPRRPAEGGALLRKQPGGVSRSMKVLPLLAQLLAHNLRDSAPQRDAAPQDAAPQDAAPLEIFIRNFGA